MDVDKYVEYELLGDFYVATNNDVSHLSCINQEIFNRFEVDRKTAARVFGKPDPAPLKINSVGYLPGKELAIVNASCLAPTDLAGLLLTANFRANVGTMRGVAFHFSGHLPDTKDLKMPSDMDIIAYRDGTFDYSEHLFDFPNDPVEVTPGIFPLDLALHTMESMKHVPQRAPSMDRYAPTTQVLMRRGNYMVSSMISPKGR